MKNICKSLLMLAVSLFVGTAANAGRYWTYDYQGGAVAATNIEAGKPYILQTGRSVVAGTTWFLWGDRFLGSTNLTTDNVYRFEAISGLTSATGQQVYYMKRDNGDYLAEPGNPQLYTKSVERAWKIVLNATTVRDPKYAYDHDNGTGDPTHYTGMDAYINEAKDQNEYTDLNMAGSTLIQLESASNALTITSYQSDNTAEPTAPYKALLSYAGDNTNDNVIIGTNYERNAWVLYAAQELNAMEALKAVMHDITNGKTMAEQIADYQIGDGVGQYSKAKHDAIMQLWEKATAITEGTTHATDAEIEALAEKLTPAYNDFIGSPNPLIPGYYILTSWRAEQTAGGYDGGAIYDRSIVDPNDMTVRWSLKEKDEVDYHANDPLSYNTCKFIWEVIKSDKDDLFYFRNFESGNYIGTAKALYQTINITTQPVNGYNIVANPKVPGYFSFYSPDLPKSSSEYSGIHTERALTNVVPWDYTSDGSSWHVRTISEDELKQLRTMLEQPRRNIKLQRIYNNAQEALAKGYVYKAVDTAGQKIETATSGDFTTKDGLVTEATQLACPMADSEEGVGEYDLPVLLDGNANTYFHSSWHGGDGTWKGGHYLQFSLNQPEDELLLKWVKRIYQGSAVLDKGAPVKVVLWGTNDESKLTISKESTTNEAGEEVINYDAWKKQGWDSLSTSTFSYPYEITVGEKTIKNAAGTAHFKAAQKYKFFRLEVITRVIDGDVPNGNKYFHGSEFRVYKAAYDEVASPIASVDQATINELKSTMTEAAKELKNNKATDAMIEKLQKAYDKFRENYPDVTRITDLVTDAEKILKTADEAVNENANRLGYYKPGAKAALQTAVDGVKADLATIQTTRQPNISEVNNFVAKLRAALTAMNAALLVPQDGLYMIQSQSSNNSNRGKVICAKNSACDDYNSIHFEGTIPVDPEKVGAEEAYKNTSDRDSHLEYYWRVTKVEKGYTFKNLFTGLYLARDLNRNGAAMHQSVEPDTIGLEFAKFPGAFNLIVGDGKETNRYVNAQPDAKSNSPLIVTWNAAEGQDNSAFAFEPIEESNINKLLGNSGSGINIDIKNKTGAQIITLPFAISALADDGFYTVVGQDPATKDVVLKKVEGTLNAGQAYIYKPADGNTSNTVTVYTVAATLNDLQVTHTPIAATNGLFGVFTETKLPKDNGILNAAGTQVLISEKDDRVAANTGYFGKMASTSETGDLRIPANSIITLISNVRLTPTTRTGIYELNGVRVKSKKNLPAGLYIINGHKVVVK